VAGASKLALTSRRSLDGYFAKASFGAPTPIRAKASFGAPCVTSVTILDDIVKTLEIEWNAMKDCDLYEDAERYECLKLNPIGNSVGVAESKENGK